MGIETLALISMATTAFSAVSGFVGAKKEAKAVARQGALDAERQGQKTRAIAARQTTSFLNSGITLAGTPTDVFESTFKTGLADTNQIIGNANNKSGNIMSSARTKLLGDIGGMAMQGAGMFGGAGSSVFGGDLTGKIGGNVSGQLDTFNQSLGVI